MVVDTHTHAWGLPTPEHPWVNGTLVERVAEFAVGPSYTAQALLSDMDALGVSEAVVVGYPLCQWTDNSYTVTAVEEHERLHGIVMIDQFASDAANALREYMSVPSVLGFRLGAICPYDQMWETFDPSTTWLRDAIDESDFWVAAQDTDAAVQILPHVDQLDQVRELVETYPDLTYLIDHYAQADPAVPPEAGRFSELGDLAPYENVVVKLSSSVHRSNEGFPYSDLHDHVRWYLDTFGPERVMWGSDYPNVSDDATYEESLRWLEHVDGLSDADRTWITERTFHRHFG